MLCPAGLLLLAAALAASLRGARGLAVVATSPTFNATGVSVPNGRLNVTVLWDEEFNDGDIEREFDATLWELTLPGATALSVAMTNDNATRLSSSLLGVTLSAPLLFAAGARYRLQFSRLLKGANTTAPVEFEFVTDTAGVSLTLLSASAANGSVLAFSATRGAFNLSFTLSQNLVPTPLDGTLCLVEGAPATVFAFAANNALTLAADPATFPDPGTFSIDCALQSLAGLPLPRLTYTIAAPLTLDTISELPTVATVPISSLAFRVNFSRSVNASAPLRVTLRDIGAGTSASADAAPLSESGNSIVFRIVVNASAPGVLRRPARVELTVPNGTLPFATSDGSGERQVAASLSASFVLAFPSSFAAFSDNWTPRQLAEAPLSLSEVTLAFSASDAEFAIAANASAAALPSLSCVVGGEQNLTASAAPPSRTLALLLARALTPSDICYATVPAGFVVSWPSLEPFGGVSGFTYAFYVARQSCQRGEFLAFNASGASNCTACPRGRFMGDAEFAFNPLRCAECALGRFANVTGMSSCLPCGPGTAQSTLGAEQCAACAPGTFSNASESALCEPCDSGRFAGSPGATACSLCDSGRFQISRGGMQCEPCAPGSVSVQPGSALLTSCTLCSPGSFQNASAQFNCTACPPGRAADRSGATTCNNCTAGRYAAAPGLDECVQCEPGRFMPNVSATNCTRCPTGRFQSRDGQLSCDECFGATRDQVGASACPTCGPGEFFNVTAGNGTCQQCPRGRFQFNQTFCAPCAPGTANSALGSIQCQACGAGEFAENPGAETCSPCVRGRFSNATGQTSCYACPLGKYQNELRRAQCIDCTPGTANDLEGQDFCGECVPGRAQNSEGASKCELCEPGRFAAFAGLRVCANCSRGRYAAGNGSTSCVSCEPGRADLRVGGGAVTCSPCEAGSFSLSEQSACTSCEPGSFSNQSQASICAPCRQGTFAQQGGLSVCEPCLAGRFALEGRAQCDACLAGTFSERGSASCVDCAPGSAQSLSASPNCTLCPPGTFADNSGSRVCSPCPRGSFAAAPGASSCSSCTAGRFGNDSALSACLRCEPGTRSSSDGALACEPCLAGRFSAQHEAVLCAACTAGEFASNESATGCQKCAPGSRSSSDGSVVCDLCTAGRFTSSPGRSSCAACLPGSFASADGLSSCSLCAPGSIAPTEASATCSLCTTGRFSPISGGSFCSACAPGTFAPSSGLSSCSPCAPGSSAPEEASAACTACTAGRFSPTAGGSFCSACVAGSFSPSSGLSSCTPCAPGSSAPSEASPSCSLCTPGRFQNRSGQPQCLDCPAGRFQDASNGTACEDCAAGRYTDEEGSSRCRDAPFGSFVPTTGSRNSTLCSAGSFQGATGQSTCEPCAIGSFESNSGRQQCRVCESGTFANASGMFFCHQCMPGTFQSASGASSCEPCPAGRAESNLGRGACTVCELGFFAERSGMSQCEPCPRGRFQNATGASSCFEARFPFFTDSPGSVLPSTCDRGFYRTLNNTACLPCDTYGVSCENGLVSTFKDFAAVFLPDGRLEVLRCVSGTCLENNQCAERHEPGSPLCGRCLPGYCYDASGHCIEEDNGSAKATSFIFATLSVLFTVAFVHIHTLGMDEFTREVRANKDEAARKAAVAPAVAPAAQAAAAAAAADFDEEKSAAAEDRGSQGNGRSANSLVHLSAPKSEVAAPSPKAGPADPPPAPAAEPSAPEIQSNGRTEYIAAQLIVYLQIVAALLRTGEHLTIFRILGFDATALRVAATSDAGCPQDNGPALNYALPVIVPFLIVATGFFLRLLLFHYFPSVHAAIGRVLKSAATLFCCCCGARRWLRSSSLPGAKAEEKKPLSGVAELLYNLGRQGSSPVSAFVFVFFNSLIPMGYLFISLLVDIDVGTERVVRSMPGIATDTGGYKAAVALSGIIFCLIFILSVYFLLTDKSRRILGLLHGHLGQLKRTECVGRMARTEQNKQVQRMASHSGALSAGDEPAEAKRVAEPRRPRVSPVGKRVKRVVLLFRSFTLPVLVPALSSEPHDTKYFSLVCVHLLIFVFALTVPNCSTESPFKYQVCGMALVGCDIALLFLLCFLWFAREPPISEAASAVVLLIALFGAVFLLFLLYSAFRNFEFATRPTAGVDDIDDEEATEEQLLTVLSRQKEALRATVEEGDELIEAVRRVSTLYPTLRGSVRRSATETSEQGEMHVELADDQGLAAHHRRVVRKKEFMDRQPSLEVEVIDPAPKA